MPVEAVSTVGDVLPASHPIELAPHDQPSPSQVALADAQAEAAETTEQLAADGDPLAIDRLRQAYESVTPDRSKQLDPQPVTHPAGPTEPGKGALIDVYD